MPSIFFSYSHADEALRDQLEKQLSVLKRQGVIETWHDRRIGAGEELHDAISTNLESADIILLLVSSDFLDSDYCYDREMARAPERHRDRDAIVIPVILRPCEWKHAPFGDLMATPLNGTPVTQAPDRDQALLEVAQAIRGAAGKIDKQSKKTIIPVQKVGKATFLSEGPRSSNLRLAKHFTDLDKDAFRLETFEYLAKFFENSLNEISIRNPDVEGVFRRIDANQFTGQLYKNGKSAAVCTVFMGGYFGKGIAYSSSEINASNSFHEHLGVEADDQAMFLTGMNMVHMSGERRLEQLSQEGAAELYWKMLIEPLQRS